MTKLIVDFHNFANSPKDNTRQVSSTKTDTLMNYIHNAAHYAETTSDMAFISSRILSWGLCKSAERIWNTVVFK